MEIHYSTDGSMLFSASTDKTGAVWDCEVGERVKKLKGHTSFVNTCCPSRRGVQHLATGSDDGTIKLWDIRKKGSAQTFNSTYQVTGFHCSGCIPKYFQFYECHAHVVG